MLRQLAPRRRIDRVADLLPAGGRRLDIEVIGKCSGSINSASARKWSMETPSAFAMRRYVDNLACMRPDSILDICF